MARAKFTPPDPVFDQPPPAGFNIRAGVKGFALLYWGLLVLVILPFAVYGLAYGAASSAESQMISVSQRLPEGDERDEAKEQIAIKLDARRETLRKTWMIGTASGLCLVLVGVILLGRVASTPPWHSACGLAAVGIMVQVALIVWLIVSAWKQGAVIEIDGLAALLYEIGGVVALLLSLAGILSLLRQSAWFIRDVKLARHAIQALRAFRIPIVSFLVVVLCKLLVPLLPSGPAWLDVVVLLVSYIALAALVVGILFTIVFVVCLLSTSWRAWHVYTNALEAKEAIND